MRRCRSSRWDRGIGLGRLALPGSKCQPCRTLPAGHGPCQGGLVSGPEYLYHDWRELCRGSWKGSKGSALPSQKIIHRFQTWSLACALLGALSGLTALLGWIVGNDTLKGGFIEGITMKTNTAIALLLTGLGIILLAPDRPTAPRRFLGH